MKKSFRSFKKIAITVGDIDGVGLEVAAKALSKISPSFKKNGALFVLFRGDLQTKLQPQLFKLIDRKWKRFTFFSLSEALLFLNSIQSIKKLPDNILIDLSLASTPAEWVFAATIACKNNLLTSLITGPLSKKSTHLLAGKPLGHTGIFRLIYPKIPLHMCFIGQSFNVLLATDHIPIGSVEGVLARGGFKKALSAALQFKKLSNSKKKIGVLGLNPHSGEKGLIGSFEKKFFKSTDLKNFEGPLIPDAAFFKKNFNRYCVFVCLYHDQGLIPFKSHHGQDSGVHLTLGLPFVRTSVDHGTASDLYNKNIANPASMLEAITLNLRLTGA